MCYWLGKIIRIINMIPIPFNYLTIIWQFFFPIILQFSFSFIILVISFRFNFHFYSDWLASRAMIHQWGFCEKRFLSVRWVVDEYSGKKYVRLIIWSWYDINSPCCGPETEVLTVHIRRAIGRMTWGPSSRRADFAFRSKMCKFMSSMPSFFSSIDIFKAAFSAFSRKQVRCDARVLEYLIYVVCSELSFDMRSLVLLSWALRTIILYLSISTTQSYTVIVRTISHTVYRRKQWFSLTAWYLLHTASSSFLDKGLVVPPRTLASISSIVRVRCIFFPVSGSIAVNSTTNCGLETYLPRETVASSSVAQLFLTSTPNPAPNVPKQTKVSLGYSGCPKLSCVNFL